MQMSEFFAKPVDPLQNRKNLESYVLSAEALSKAVTIAISSIGFAVFGYKLGADYTGVKAVGFIVGLLFAGISAFVTDFAFSELLENGMFNFFKFWTFSWRKRQLSLHRKTMSFLRWLLVVIIVTGLTYADWISVSSLRSPIADFRKAPTLTNTDSLKSLQDRRLSSRIAPISEEIKDLKSQIKTTERSVKNANPALLRLIAEGNTWAPGELRKTVDRATQPLRERLAKLQAQKDAVMASEYSSATAETEMVSEVNKQKIEADTELASSVKLNWMLFGFWTKIACIAFRLFLILSFFAEGRRDENGDGVVDGADVTEWAKGTPATMSHHTYRHPSHTGPSDYTTAPVSHERGAEPPGRTTVLNSVQQPHTAPIRAFKKPDAPSDTILAPTTELNALVGECATWQSYARQYHRRSHPARTKSADARAKNAQRRELLCAMLDRVGWKSNVMVGETVADYDIEFRQESKVITKEDLDKVNHLKLQLQTLQGESFQKI